MSLPSPLERLRPCAVPTAIVIIVALAVLLVPPLVLGEVTARTYAITAAILVLALGTAFPYALLVALGTLPLLYAETASYAAPQPSADVPHSFSVLTALRHVIAGTMYALAAAAVGAIGVGAQIGGTGVPEAVPTALQPVLLFLGGALVGAAFVFLQLWRYERPVRTLDWQTSLWTAVLGALLAVSPVVAYRTFENAAG